MNLTRLIKLKMINDELDNLTEQERCFLSLFENLTKKGNMYYYIDDNSHILRFMVNEYDKSISSSLSLFRHFSNMHNIEVYKVVDVANAILHDKLNIRNYHFCNSFLLT